MSAYLAEHVPHLQSLHVSLGLPPEALSSDQNQIETAIKNAVTTLIRNREGEVEGWRDSIADVKRSMVSLGRALGVKGKEAVTAARRESDSLEALPLQHEKLVTQRTALEKEYDERLAKIEALGQQIDHLAQLLGTPFQPAKPLQPIAGPSRTIIPPPAQDAGLKTRTPSLTTKPSVVVRRGSSITARATPPKMPETVENVPWLDVSDEVLDSLQGDLQRAVEERETRLQQLLDHFHDLLFLRVELCLPPVPISLPHHFPIQLLPSRASEERPGVHATYEKTLSRYFSANMPTEEEEAEDWSKGMEGVEPEVGLLAWSEELNSLWTAERDSRTERIQGLYDQLEPLWLRLDVEQDVQDLFIEMNRGCGDAVIKAYETELERCLELRRSSLSSFVVSARQEMEILWDELMLSDDERGDFGPFIDDDYTEELLKAHEEEVERLRAEIESKAIMLPKVRDWHALKVDEEELERAQNDPNRFSKRGGVMLREEKLRKRVGILLPKVETDLLNVLPKWEEANGRPFMVQGERVVDKIYDAREAKESAKEAKKRAKLGLAPMKISSKATPANPTLRSHASSTNFDSLHSRKREAPTPTPFGSSSLANVKRQRVTPVSSLKPMTKSHTATRSLASVNNNSNHNSTRGTRDPGSSPTPTSNLPRAVSHTSVRSISYSTYHGYTTLGGGGGGASIGRTRVQPLNIKGKERRESFKPRQSVVGGFLVAAKSRRDSWDVLEVDEDGDDVF